MAEPSGGKSFPLSVVIQAVDKITSPLRGITNQIAQTSSRISGLGSSFGKLVDRSGIPVLTASFSRLGGATKGVFEAGGRTIGMFAKIAATAGLSAGGVAMLAQSYADATGKIGDTAERTGISRERLQELGYAAQMAGSSAETMQGALSKMNITLGTLQGGSKELKKMFDGLRISLKNSNGTAKSTDQQFDAIVTQLAKIKDPALQAKAAVTIFGKSATELLPLIKSGTAGINDMGKEARRLGVVISDSGVRQGEEFGDVLDRLKFAFAGVGNTIGVALTPVLIQLGTELTENIIKYRPEIEKFAAAFAGNLPGYITQFKDGLQRTWDVLEPLAHAVVVLSDNLGAVTLAFDVVAGVTVATMLPSLISLTTALWGVAAAFLATPFGLFVAGAALVAGAAALIYTKWDGIAKFFSDTFQKIGDGFKWLTNLMGDSDLGGQIEGRLSAIQMPSAAPATVGIRPNPQYTAIPQGGPIAAGLANAKGAIMVEFKNAPPGTQVDSSSGPGLQIQTKQGFGMMRNDQ